MLLISLIYAVGNHVAVSDVNDGVAKAFKTQVDNQAKELFLPFRAFCTRKDVSSNLSFVYPLREPLHYRSCRRSTMLHRDIKEFSLNFVNNPALLISKLSK